MNDPFGDTTRGIRGSKWVTISENDPDTGEPIYHHVVPVNDRKPHDTGLLCDCDPDIQFEDPEDGEKYEAPLITHNSFDGREALAEAKQILNL